MQAAAAHNKGSMAPLHQQAFYVGVNFHIAALRAGEDRTVVPGKITTASVAMITNFAFATELYLKSLLAASNRSTRGHDLEVLFNKLLPTDRAGLVAKYLSLVDQTEAQLLSDIQTYAGAFAEWRYIFETNAEKPIFVYKLAELARASFLYVSEKTGWADDAVKKVLSPEPAKGAAIVVSLGGGHMLRYARE